jgi:hypothetical protein
VIDVHAHLVPGGYRAALLASGHSQPDGYPHIPEWTLEEHVAAMDRLGIQTSLLSISSPVSTSVAGANPAVTVGRAFSDTFAGIEPSSVPMFVGAQLVGALAATGLILVLYPHSEDQG